MCASALLLTLKYGRTIQSQIQFSAADIFEAELGFIVEIILFKRCCMKIKQYPQVAYIAPIN